MIKIVTDSLSQMTVNDLIDALSALPGDAKIDPFGEYEVALAYDDKENRAYIDSRDWIEDFVESEE